MKHAALIAVALVAVALVIYVVSGRPSLDEAAEEVDSGGRTESTVGRTVTQPPHAHRGAMASSQQLSAIYGATDLASQEILYLSTQGALKLDAALLYRYGLELCSYLSGTKSRTFTDHVISMGNASPQDVASARMLDTYRSGYCSSGTSISEPLTHDYIEKALAEASAAGDLDADALLKAMEQLSQDNGHDTASRAAVENRLVDTLRRTTSPAMFMLTASLLLDPAFGNWAPDGFEGHSANEDELALAKQFGVQIAMCSEFNICGHRSVYTLRACMPTQCDPQRGMDGYLQRRLSRDQYYLASKYADALRIMRRNR